MLRLWVSSMEDEAIREGFAHLRPGLAFNGVYEAALCRAQADWLVGHQRHTALLYRLPPTLVIAG